ncbi:transcriptional regulator [Streptomyces sp. NBC_00249]|uniref:PaaX family transcriptional regulator C-terminal domain-containing protein n=1 Tax=Streptomyces sp. NBC_00249 TaxID=2975690 RepID=UPI002252DD99|nr:PaaX family transcriptional regulator C-terminal domain-containing protein [Streptomyces sp. NBC_00249]MCX5196120.1 transcriptional regulator [Streptomyces sp. NBC_00249]
MSTHPTDPAPVSGVPTRLVVHALVREDGTVDGGELYEVAGALGMSDQQVRLCVKRLVAEGRFTQEGRGRRAVLRLTAPGAPPLPEVEFVRHAYRQDRGLEPWDGVWHLFAFAVPESARAARDALRDTLTALGAAPVQGGLYATPNAIGPYVRARAAELGVTTGLTCLTSRDLAVGGADGPARLAARLWPLEEIAGRYEALRALAEGPGAGLAHAVSLAAAFSEAMRPDPLLPPELLPQPWPGTTARTAATTAWTRLRAAAPPDAPKIFRLYAEALTP